MTTFRLFGKSATNEAAERILEMTIQAARDPDLYRDGCVPDTLDGRFELATVFATLALLRLKSAPDADRVAQTYTDKLFRHFDAGLREAGVGDLSVARRMKGLASAFYGRLSAYQAALADEPALSVALGRNIWNAADAPYAPELARQVCAIHTRQAAAPEQALETAEAWLIITA